MKIRKYLYCIAVFTFILGLILPIHYPPISSFFSQLFTFITFFLLLLSQKKILVFQKTLGILLVLVMPIIQYLFNQILFFQTLFFVEIYLISIFLVINLGYTFTDKYSEEKLVTIIAKILFIFGVISSFFSIIQIFGIENIYIFVEQLKGRRVYANMMQPNHLASFLVFSLVSAWYLNNKKILGNFLYYSSSIAFLIILVFTQSRMGWLTYLIFCGLLIINKNSLSLKKILPLIILFFTLLFLIPKISQYFLSSNIENLSDRLSNSNSRLLLWKQMYFAILDNPTLGYGWYQTSIAQFNIIDRYPNHEWVKSAHNILLDLLLWNGILVGACIFLYYIFIFLYPIIKISYSREKIFLYAILLTIFIHSFLEYPLFYSFYLLPMAFLLGIVWYSLDKKYYTLSIKNIIFICMVFGFLLFLVLREYLNFNDDYSVIEIQKLEHKKKITSYNSYYIFDLTLEEIKWQAMYPLQEMNGIDLKNIEKIVELNITYSNLCKLNQIYKYNNDYKNANHILIVSKNMYNKNCTVF